MWVKGRNAERLIGVNIEDMGTVLVNVHTSPNIMYYIDVWEEMKTKHSQQFIAFCNSFT